MASGRATWLERNILFKISFLYKKCPAGNYHHFWDRLCYCRCDEHDSSWHGGIYDFKTGDELQFCETCLDEQTKRIYPNFELIKNEKKKGKAK